MADAGSFNNTVATAGVGRRVEEVALAVISRWVREVRPRWCCMCHDPFTLSAFHEKDGMCLDCRMDLMCGEPGPFQGRRPDCRCSRCVRSRAWAVENRGKIDKITGVRIL